MSYRERFKFMLLLEKFNNWCLILPANYNSLRWDVMSITYYEENYHRLKQIDPAVLPQIVNLSEYHRNLQFFSGSIAAHLRATFVDEEESIDKNSLYRLDTVFLALEMYRQKTSLLKEERAAAFAKDVADLFDHYCTFYEMLSLAKTGSDYSLVEVTESILEFCSKESPIYELDEKNPKYEIYKNDSVKCDEDVISHLERLKKHIEEAIEDVMAADMNKYDSDLSDIIDMSNYYCDIEEVLEDFNYIAAAQIDNLATLEDN